MATGGLVASCGLAQTTPMRTASTNTCVVDDQTQKQTTTEWRSFKKREPNSDINESSKLLLKSRQKTMTDWYMRRVTHLHGADACGDVRRSVRLHLPFYTFQKRPVCVVWWTLPAASIKTTAGNRRRGKNRASPRTASLYSINSTHTTHISSTYPPSITFFSFI